MRALQVSMGSSGPASLVGPSGLAVFGAFVALWIFGALGSVRALRTQELFWWRVADGLQNNGCGLQGNTSALYDAYEQRL